MECVCLLIIFITLIIKIITIFIKEIIIFTIKINLNLILYNALKHCFWRPVWERGGLSLTGNAHFEFFFLFWMPSIMCIFLKNADEFSWTSF